jgi:diguanylate cyclase (GGDEF)-like protein
MMRWHVRVKPAELDDASSVGRPHWTIILILAAVLLLFTPQAISPVVAVLPLVLLVLALLRMQALTRQVAQSRHALKRYSRMLQSVFDNMGEGIIVSDETGRLMCYNPAAEQLLRASLTDAISPEWAARHGVFLPDMATICPVDRLPLFHALHGETVEDRELFIQHRDAPNGIWLSCSARPLRAQDGTYWGGVMTLRDITERKHAEALQKAQMQQINAYSAMLLEANGRLETLATTDSLTEVKNRRAFRESLAHETQRAARYHLPLSLCFLDVDVFKSYNDEFGHLAGDDVLRQVAMLAIQSARKTDVVARYGGEEFALILPNTDQEGAAALAERIRENVEAFPWPHRPVTVSIGVATYSAEHTDDNRFIAEADGALYVAKNSGRNRVVHSLQLAIPDTQAVVQHKESRQVA